MDTHKRGNGGKIQAMVTSHYFIVCQVALLIISDHCVKKPKHMMCPHAYIFFKFLWNGFHMLHWISKSYGVQITPLGRSYRHCLTCMQTRRREGR